MIFFFFWFLVLSFFCCLLDSDFTCSKIMRLFHGEFPANEAKELGTYLDVPHARIQEFRENNMGNANGMLIDLLNYWLETDSEKSWRKLAEAVKNCGYRVLADKLRQKSSQLLEGSAGEFPSDALLFMLIIDCLLWSIGHHFQDTHHIVQGAHHIYKLNPFQVLTDYCMIFFRTCKDNIFLSSFIFFCLLAWLLIVLF